MCSWLAPKGQLGKEGAVTWCSASHCQVTLLVKAATWANCLLPKSYFCKVEPAWEAHRQLKPSIHLEADLALTLTGLCSQSWETGFQLHLHEELDLHQMDAALLYLLWSFLPPEGLPAAFSAGCSLAGFS